MAPMRELLVSTSPKTKTTNNFLHKNPKMISMESLKRTISDISFDLKKELSSTTTTTTTNDQAKLPAISEVEDAKCECCGMSEECTPNYIKRVREKFNGKLVCGLCGEAVKEEMEKNGGNSEKALSDHMSACAKFNRIGRTNPVLFQVEAMKEMLKKSTSIRGKSISPRDLNSPKKGGIARSSSCMSAITKDLSDSKLAD